MVTPMDIAGAPLVEWAFEFDPNGKFITYASNENEAGILQLYQKFLDSEYPPRQLTSDDDEPVKKAFLSPQGDKLAVLKDKGGNELFKEIPVFVMVRPVFLRSGQGKPVVNEKTHKNHSGNG